MDGWDSSMSESSSQEMGSSGVRVAPVGGKMVSRAVAGLGKALLSNYHTFQHIPSSLLL